MPLSERVATMMASDLPPLERRISGDNHVLTLTVPDTAHSVWLFWTPEWDFRFWYVNLQEPIRRTPRGILVQDQVLDIIVNPDRTWRWKDEDEFRALGESGFFTDEESASIRAEGEKMIAAIEGNDPPFCEGWESWRADPGWPLPGISSDWDVIQ
jgi:predicted RNA-binding protein associated with RNAse of E/G family